MEIEGKDGTKLFLKPGVKSVFGRGAGFNTDDLTVSRRHISLQFKPAGAEESDRVSFEVIGRNPIWVKTGESKIRTFRKSESGEIAAGDRVCVSGNLPIWFNLKRRDGSGLDSIDIDPVKEFGFLVIGKEFDQYTKSRNRDVKQWEWFLEDATNGNSDDDGDTKRRKGLSKKRRRKEGNEDDDDDWSVESDEDETLMTKSKRVMNPSYSTRSKNTTKNDTNASSSSSSGNSRTQNKQRVDVGDDEDDETLGGFIVSDEEAEMEENVDEEEDIDEDEEEDDD